MVLAWVAAGKAPGTVAPSSVSAPGPAAAVAGIGAVFVVRVQTVVEPNGRYLPARIASSLRASATALPYSVRLTAPVSPVDQIGWRWSIQLASSENR